jgi:hypothetical protein
MAKLVNLAAGKRKKRVKEKRNENAIYSGDERNKQIGRAHV